MAASPPIIDITALRTYRGAGEAAATIGAIDGACTDTGFFVATGHGLDAPMTSMFAMARAFFALPQSEKEAIPRIERYGFVPHAGTAIDRDRASDKTEYIDLGLADEVPLPTIDGFETALRTYQGQTLEVTDCLLRALAIALDLPPDFFGPHMRRPQCRLRFLHYLPTPTEADGSRAVLNTPHTDYGLITLLATDGVPGLEVEPRGGQWTPIAAPEGSLVINLGDMLARWTNDRYVSTPHRVVGSAEVERISISSG